jgi:hypothetical protein
VAVQNIRALIPVVLDLTAGNYNRWRDQFLLTVGKYSLQDHVLQNDSAPSFPDWQRMDCVVKSWIFGTITDDLAASISSRNSTARVAWLAVESQFLNNKETRALLLEAKFRNFVQGDLSVAEYCKEMKRMADTLEDLGETVSDRTLILNVIRGLNERFKAVGMHLRRGRPFPTFVDAKADLLLEEMTMEHHSTQATALATSTAPTSATGGPSQGSGGATASQGGPSAPPPKSRRSRGGGKGSG